MFYFMQEFDSEYAKGVYIEDNIIRNISLNLRTYLLMYNIIRKANDSPSKAGVLFPVGTIKKTKHKWAVVT